MRPALAQRLLAWRVQLQHLLHISEWQITLVWAIAAGMLGALATEGFRLGLDLLDQLVLGRSGNLVAIAHSLPWWARVLVPTAGGLVAGLLLAWARKRPDGQESGDYMESIAVGDGRIPVGQTLLRSASSMFSIASGGSIGREGPMVQLGAMGASLLGRVLRMPVERLRLLVACGGAAGITAAYNAPIAGAFFIAEIVLGSIAMQNLGPIMVAAVSANVLMRSFPGYAPTYQMPAFPTVAGAEVLLFVLLGLIVGPASTLVSRSLLRVRALFARLRLALPWRLALGGLVAGSISVYVPEVWGNGYNVVSDMLYQHMAWQWLLLLLLAKVAATLATVGSGAVGGMFTPTLFFGCATGTLFGYAAQSLWPGAVAAPFAYGIVGMAAFLAASSQAPLMALLMIFEMTLSYEIMLPLMATCVVAYFVARSMRAPMMYSVTQLRRQQEDQQLQLRAQHMRDMVQPAQTIVGPDADVPSMSRMFLQYPVKYLYVVDDRQHYLGVVPLKALGAKAAENGQAGDKPQPPIHTNQLRAADLLTQEITALPADMALGPALQRFMEHRGERLPVVESLDKPVLIGVVYKSALLDTYVRLSG